MNYRPALCSPTPAFPRCFLRKRALHTQIVVPLVLFICVPLVSSFTHCEATPLALGRMNSFLLLVRTYSLESPTLGAHPFPSPVWESLGSSQAGAGGRDPSLMGVIVSFILYFHDIFQNPSRHCPLCLCRCGQAYSES